METNQEKIEETEEMVETKDERKLKEKTVLFSGFGLTILIFVFFCLVMKSLLDNFIGSWASIVWLIPIVFYLSGLRVVTEEKRRIIEILGQRWKTKGPGLIWVFPVLMKTRETISIWEQPIPLFISKPWVDFLQGGQARLVECILWGKPKGKTVQERQENAMKLVYAIEKWKKAVREEGETSVRSYLGQLTVEAVFEKIGQGNWWTQVVEKFPNLPKVFAEWGWETTKLTITDFEWSKDVVATRQQVYEAQRKPMIAKFLVEESEQIVKARTMITNMPFQGLALAKGKTMEELLSDPNIELAFIRHGEDINIRDIAGRYGVLTQICTDGSEGIEKVLLNVLATGAKLLSKGAVQPSISTSPEEPEEEEVKTVEEEPGEKSQEDKDWEFISSKLKKKVLTRKMLNSRQWELLKKKFKDKEVLPKDLTPNIIKALMKE